MSSEMIERYFITNNMVMEVAEADKISTNSSRTIYEVIRVLSGVPLFLERHVERLEASAGLVGCSVATIKQKVTNSIFELIKVNGNPNKNIKIIVYNLESSTPDYLAYFIESNYPTAEEYSKGVHAILLKEERTNPNAKIVNKSYKERVAAALSEENAYEALLVNNKNEITEGSRSNMFFIKNDTVLTAPKGNVLIGITRVCVFELCEKLKFKIVEQPISATSLGELDGVFMSGTSPKLLPINSVDDIHFNSSTNHVIKALMKGYDDMLEEYIKEKGIG